MSRVGEPGEPLKLSCYTVCMTTKELIEEVLSLPVEERALVVDSLLRSLNAPQREIDRQWTEVARQRLEELRSGTVEAVPGDEVLRRIHARFSK